MPVRRRSAPPKGSQSIAASATENLHLSLAQMRTALNSLPMGVIVVDQSGAEWWRNRAAHDLLDAAGNSEQVREAIGLMSRRVLRGASERSEMEVKGPPNQMVEVRTVPLVNGGGLIVLEDVTERYLMDRVRTDFVANISHELKTPVGAMSLLAETILGELQERVSNEELTSLAHRIVDESHRVSRIIDDLLELASIEFGGAAPATRTSMRAVVAEAAARIQPFADNKGIAVTRELLDGEVDVAGSSQMLVSAVANLIENAVKYSASGSHVVVTLEADQSEARVAVADSGIGIAPEHVDRIFERFYRVDPGRSRETGGTGLGLSIVRHIVTNHGGDVTVSSVVGQGTTFTIHLPLYRG